MHWFTERPNFGDVLAPIVVAHVSNATPVLVSGRCRGKVIAVGSILQVLAEQDIVWGSGAIRDAPIIPPANVTFCAVRGPLTRALVHGEVPEVYGDPAMLLPRIYTPPAVKKDVVGVIPHFREIGAVRSADPSVSMIDILSDWRDVIDRIAECEAVLSSSLHGLIVAEAYGVPAMWFTATDKVGGGGFKFRDYYLSTGRDVSQPVPWNDSIASMMRGLSDAPCLDVRPLLNAWPDELRFADTTEGN
jgi:pyruvyltransferase